MNRDKVRVFDFDPKIDFKVALDTIEMALDDEDLHLAGRWLQGFCPAHAVREPSRLRVIVPLQYIVRNPE